MYILILTYLRILHICLGLYILSLFAIHTVLSHTSIFSTHSTIYYSTPHYIICTLYTLFHTTLYLTPNFTGSLVAIKLRYRHRCGILWEFCSITINYWSCALLCDWLHALNLGWLDLLLLASYCTYSLPMLKLRF